MIILYGIDLRQDGMIYLLERHFGGDRHRSVAHGYNRYNRNLDRVIPSLSVFLCSDAEDRGKSTSTCMGLWKLCEKASLSLQSMVYGLFPIVRRHLTKRHVEEAAPVLLPCP